MVAQNLDHHAIIRRGYALEDEYGIMLHSGQLERVMLVANLSDGPEEGLWCYPLPLPEPTALGVPSPSSDPHVHFVFCNNPMMFWGGPRSAIGMVGVARYARPLNAGPLEASESACLELFKAAGQAAIDYYRERVPSFEPGAPTWRLGGENDARKVVRAKLEESRAKCWTVDNRMVATWLTAAFERAPKGFELAAGEAAYRAWWEP